MEINTILNKELVQKFAGFLEYANPAALSKNLRNLLLLYLMNEDDLPPAEIQEMLPDLYELFQLLDASEETAS